MVLTSFTTIETNNLNIIGGNYSSGNMKLDIIGGVLLQGNMKLDIIGGGSTSSGNMKWILLEESAASNMKLD
jgi:hypothetical protein